MLIPNLKIRRVATASLVLGGTVAGCGDDESLAEGICRVYQDCETADFEDYYDSIDECVQAVNADIDGLEDEVSASCARALRSLYSCYVDAQSNRCVDGADLEDECASEYDRYYDACSDE